MRSKETRGMVRGTRYLTTGRRRLLLWSSKVHIQAELRDTDYLYTVVGQSGEDACQIVSTFLSIWIASQKVSMRVIAAKSHKTILYLVEIF